MPGTRALEIYTMLMLDDTFLMLWKASPNCINQPVYVCIIDVLGITSIFI